MNETTFLEIMGLLDWEKEGDDDEVILPVIERLASLEDAEIFAFDDHLAKNLYSIDGRSWAEGLYGSLNDMSSDDFLYARCVAAVNGVNYYRKILNHEENLDPELEFEAILYVPPIAWAVKHDADVENYPHETEYSFETGSNSAQWSADAE